MFNEKTKDYDLRDRPNHVKIRTKIKAFGGPAGKPSGVYRI